eukprot:298246-Prymnesium_polylepis.1
MKKATCARGEAGVVGFGGGARWDGRRTGPMRGQHGGPWMAKGQGGERAGRVLGLVGELGERPRGQHGKGVDSADSMAGGPFGRQHGRRGAAHRDCMDRKEATPPFGKGALLPLHVRPTDLACAAQVGQLCEHCRREHAALHRQGRVAPIERLRRGEGGWRRPRSASVAAGLDSSPTR